MSKLVIVVPADRQRCGRALLFGDDGSTRLGPFRVLATASQWAATHHGNDARDWRKPFGHPPAGSYVVSGSLPPGMAPRPRRVRRFGPLGALVLTPIGGDALDALKAGRRRFLLHGGPTDRRGRLRPTFGGFRISDRELGALLRAVNDANAAHDAVSTVEVVETSDRPPWANDRPRDRAGRLRPSFLPARNGARSSISPSHATLIVLGFGIAGEGVKAGASTGRRGFVGLALLTLGALGASACGGANGPVAEENPSPDPCGMPYGEVGAGNAPDAGAGDDGGGAEGGYTGQADGGEGTSDGGADLNGCTPGDGTGDDSSGGGG